MADTSLQVDSTDFVLVVDDQAPRGTIQRRIPFDNFVAGLDSRVPALVTPYAYGGVGDGVTDDTVALQAWIDAAVGATVGTAPVTGRYAQKIAFLPPGSWKFTSKLRVISVLHFHMICHPDAFLMPIGTWADSTVAFEINGAYHCVFDGLTFRQSGSSPTLTDVLAYDWTSAVASRSSTANIFRNIHFLNIAWANAAFAIGKNSGASQVDETTYHDITINGAYVVGSGNTTTYQYGVQCGSGTHGNIIGHHFYGFRSSSCRYNFWANCVSDVQIVGFGVGSAEADFKHSGSTVFKVQGGRSESSTRLLIQPGGSSAPAAVFLSDILYSTDALDADLRFIQAYYAGSMTLTNVYVNQLTMGAVIHASTTGNVPLSVSLIGCLAPTTAETVVERTSATNISVQLIGYARVAADGTIAELTPVQTLQLSGGASDSRFGTAVANVRLGTGGTSSGYIDTGGAATDIDLNIRAKGVGTINAKSTIVVDDAKNIAFNATTGTKIGTATTQKIGFWNATPVVQQAAVADATGAGDVVAQLNSLLAKLRTIGLIAT